MAGDSITQPFRVLNSINPGTCSRTDYNLISPRMAEISNPPAKTEDKPVKEEKEQKKKYVEKAPRAEGDKKEEKAEGKADAKAEEGADKAEKGEKEKRPKRERPEGEAKEKKNYPERERRPKR